MYALLCKIVTRVQCTFPFSIQADTPLYGIDWNGPIPDSEDADHVEVATTRKPLEEQDFLHLQATISPVSYSDCHGVDLFIRSVEFFHQKLAQ